MILNYDKRSLLRYVSAIGECVSAIGNETMIFLCGIPEPSHPFSLETRKNLPPPLSLSLSLPRIFPFQYPSEAICLPVETPSSADRSLCVCRQLDAAYRGKARKCSETKRNRTKQTREREREYTRVLGVAAGARQRRRKRREANERGRLRVATLHTFEIERPRRSSQSVTILLQDSVNGLHQGEAVFH